MLVVTPLAGRRCCCGERVVVVDAVSVLDCSLLPVPQGVLVLVVVLEARRCPLCVAAGRACCHCRLLEVVACAVTPPCSFLPPPNMYLFLPKWQSHQLKKRECTPSCRHRAGLRAGPVVTALARRLVVFIGPLHLKGPDNQK